MPGVMAGPSQEGLGRGYYSNPHLYKNLLRNQGRLNDVDTMNRLNFVKQRKEEQGQGSTFNTGECTF